nr:hypothetical protein [Evansella caseinilytica]
MEQARSNEPDFTEMLRAVSSCVIARDGTWIDVGVLLTEEETMSGANPFFLGRL